MYYKKVPEWLFIIYYIDANDFRNGCFTPRIQNSIPFATKDEAEKYKLDYINNIESICDNYEKILQFAVIPIYPIYDVKILHSCSQSIRIGKTKTLRVDNYKPIKWSINSEIGATFISDGNSITVSCPDGDYEGKTITVKAEVDGITDECVLNVVSDV